MSHAAGLVEEEMTLPELLQARKLCHVRIAKVLGISQDGVCRLVESSDLRTDNRSAPV
jgi:hypothetical protein